MPTFLDSFGPLSSTIHGILVSSILIPASLTSFFAGNIADYMGRIITCSLGGLIFAAGTALEAGAQNLAMLFVGRCITGVGEGLFLSTLVVYVCEIAPARQRGVLASVQQLLVTMGIAVGYFVCYGTVRSSNTSFSWRFPFALQSFLAFTYALLTFFFLPESPRWLKSKGRMEDSHDAWDRLGLADAEREKNEQQNQNLNIQEPESLALTPIRSRQSVHDAQHTSWLAVFSKGARKRTFLGCFVMGMQQLSGIDGVLYYAPLLFQQAGLNSATSSFLASGVSALLMFLITIPSFMLADKWGRRTSTIVGGILLSGTMFIIGALYASGTVHGDHGAARWVVIVLIYIFALTYCATWAVGIKIYASEIQSPKTRAPATSLAQSSNWVVNFVVAFTTPVFLQHSSSGIYFMFGAASLLTVVVCATEMPETKGKTLEEIDKAFEHSDEGQQTSMRMKALKLLRKWQRGRLNQPRATTEEHEL
ncbi:general substrate transporter [Aureobasidium subglaciale]|nr:general substrate transporter [Aureobasidium subglaciale]KAI5228445.1 general substrate transporter [Aureobasidium subglaciale]KAI5231963.1 general substrate transporter [Aureobasidium subglaciale]KAI5265740.1 general substrate transporter [Aureobasidium subglaciale]